MKTTDTTTTRGIPVRFSWLKKLALSPAHALLAAHEPRTDPAAGPLLIGQALHAIVLGTRPVERYDGVRRGAAWEEWRIARSQALILSPAEYERAARMADAVRGHAAAMNLLGDGAREQERQWTTGGRECAGRPDVSAAHHVIELKSTRCAAPGWFAREAVRRGYHTQVAWYRSGCCELDATGYIVAVESAPPYPAVVYRLTQDAMIAADGQWRLWLERLRVHEESGVYPGYAQSIVPLDVETEQDLIFEEDT